MNVHSTTSNTKTFAATLASLFLLTGMPVSYSPVAAQRFLEVG